MTASGLYNCLVDYYFEVIGGIQRNNTVLTSPDCL